MKKVWYAPNKFESYGEQEIQAVVDCLRSGWLAGFGPKSIEFEERVAKHFGKKYIEDPVSYNNFNPCTFYG